MRPMGLYVGAFVFGVLGAVMVAYLIYTLSGGSEVKGVTGTPQGRWHNVLYPTAITLEGSSYDVYVYAPLDRQNMENAFLSVDYPGNALRLEVDGASGSILRRSATPDAMRKALLDTLEASLKVDPFDPRNAGWPYQPGSGGDPDPLSGIVQSTWFSEGTPGQSHGTMYQNFRSRIVVWNTETTPAPGMAPAPLTYSCEKMDEADKAAFHRLVLSHGGPGTATRAVDYATGLKSCVLEP